MKRRCRHLLQRVTTIACAVVGTILLVGMISAFFVSRIEGDLTLPPTYRATRSARLGKGLRWSNLARRR
jgi:hypothetical protein